MPVRRGAFLERAAPTRVCASCCVGLHTCEGLHRDRDGLPLVWASTGATIVCDCPCNLVPWPFEHAGLEERSGDEQGAPLGERAGNSPL